MLTLDDGTLPTERWVRLPTRGVCPYTGLTRSGLYRLIADGKIKSASLKRPGQIRGVRLLWLPSVMSEIERHVDVQGRA